MKAPTTWVLLRQHHLRQSRFIAHDHELHALLVADRLRPAADRDLLADMRGQLGYEGALHGGDPISAGPNGALGGAISMESAARP